EVGVREDLGRGIPAPAGDVSAGHGRGDGPDGLGVVHSGSTSIRGCFALTRAPLSGTTLTTRPARSDLISLKSFIASIRPMTWPTATSRPTATNAAEPGAGELYQTPVSGALTLGLAGGSARPLAVVRPVASPVPPGSIPPAVPGA